MKPAQVNKLYEKLTPEEQANLCFEANVRGDNADYEAIKSAIEYRNYQAPHHDFRLRSIGLLSLAFYYRGEYWEALSKMVLGLCLDADEARQFSGKLAAMEAALDQTCKKLKVDVEAVRKVAGCLKGLDVVYNPFPDVSKHRELVNQYCECFEGITT